MATRVPLKQWIGMLSPKLGRHYSETTDRAVKMVTLTLTLTRTRVRTLTPALTLT